MLVLVFAVEVLQITQDNRLCISVLTVLQIERTAESKQLGQSGLFEVGDQAIELLGKRPVLLNIVRLFRRFQFLRQLFELLAQLSSHFEQLLELLDVDRSVLGGLRGWIILGDGQSGHADQSGNDQRHNLAGAANRAISRMETTVLTNRGHPLFSLD